MSELRGWRMNVGVEEALESGAADIPNMGKDDPFQGPPPFGMLVDDALTISDEGGRVSSNYGRPWAPWEIIL